MRTLILAVIPLLISINAVACSETEDVSDEPIDGDSDAVAREDLPRGDAATSNPSISPDAATRDADVLDAATDAEPDATKPTFIPPPSCSSITMPSTIVTPTCAHELVPKLAGGAVAVGTYALESVVRHEPSSCTNDKIERVEETLEISASADGFTFKFLELYPDRTKAPVGARFDNNAKPTKSGPPYLLFSYTGAGCTAGAVAAGFWSYETFTGKDGKARISWGAETTRTYVLLP